MDKLSINFQNQFRDRLIYDETVFHDVDPCVKLHNETKTNPLSSAASCLNVLGSLRNQPEELKIFLNQFNLEIEEIYKFPTGSNINGRIYNDTSYVIVEWVGPQKSPINEKGGSRGQNRTSIDAFVIAKIKGKITQLLIEWKFTEGRSRSLVLNRFGGNKGLERLRRYSKILIKFRGKNHFPFNFIEDGGLGLYDFSIDHLYQLLRMTLLAKTTTPIKIGDLEVEDYRIVHLSHSANPKTEILFNEYLTYSPNLKQYAGQKLYHCWIDILTSYEKEKFRYGHWNLPLKTISDKNLKQYLVSRYSVDIEH